MSVHPVLFESGTIFFIQELPAGEYRRLVYTKMAACLRPALQVIRNIKINGIKPLKDVFSLYNIAHVCLKIYKAIRTLVKLE